MEVLTYSPKVWVYAACYKKDEFKYLDLSDDVVSCEVMRKTDAASIFKVTIQNKSGKYNKVLAPMDRVTIYASGANGKKYQLLTGYITTVPAFKLFNEDFSISGKCSIYRLERFYWDADLISSYEDFARNSTYMHESGAGIANLIRDLLVNVAGMDKSMIAIGDIPQSVIEWAQEMYESQFGETENLIASVDDFYRVLEESSPKVAGGESSTVGFGDFSGNSNAEIIFNYCVSQGCTKQVAAAIVGNAQQESGCDPTADGVATGVFQFEGGTGSASEFKSWAAAQGLEWNTLEAQLPYLFNQLPGCFSAYTGNGVYTYGTGAQAWWPTAMTFDEFKKNANIAEATEIFERVYERASIPMMENRIKYAQEAYSAFA